MRVLCVSAGLDAAFGGPPQAMMNSVLAAQRNDIEIHVVFPHYDPSKAFKEPVARDLVAAGIKTRAFPLNQRFGKFNRTRGVSTSMAAWLWRNCRDYDVIHVHSAWGLHCVAAIAGARRWRRPVVLSPHESLTRFDMSHAHNALLRVAKFGLRTVYKASLRGVVFSSGLELRDSRYGREAREWTVIPHPVTVEPATRARFQDDITRIGYLGRLHPKKNVESLLTAMVDLPPHVTLTIAGAGSEEYGRTLRDFAAELGVSSRVTWLGFVKDDAKQTFFNSVDLMVMPSHYECFGMSAAEAMAAGIAVLVSPETGVADLVRTYDAGVVSDPAPACIRDAAMGLLDDRRALSQCGDNGLRATREVLSLDAHGRALRTYYERIAA